MVRQGRVSFSPSFFLESLVPDADKMVGKPPDAVREAQDKSAVRVLCSEPKNSPILISLCLSMKHTYTVFEQE